MKSKKKIIALALAMLLLLTAFVAATFAYFTDTEFAKNNVITIGNVEIDLYEHSEQYAADPGDDVLKENDEDYRDVFLKAPEQSNLLPGQNVPKYTYIKNTGKNPAYVRFVVTVPAELNEFLTLTFNTTDYLVTHDTNEDNVYFVTAKEPLAVGALSTPGLTNVALNVDLSEKDLASFQNVFNGESRDFNISVAAHAIQTVGFSDAAGAFGTFDANGANVQNEKVQP